MKTDVEGEEGEPNEDQNGDTLDKDDDSKNKKEEISDIVTKEQMDNLSKELGEHWKNLATELNFEEDEITYFGSEHTDVISQARQMLTVWQVIIVVIMLSKIARLSMCVGECFIGKYE